MKYPRNYSYLDHKELFYKGFIEKNGKNYIVLKEFFFNKVLYREGDNIWII